MLETLLSEITSAGWTLGYLRQAGPTWEVQLLRPSADPDYSYDLAYWSAQDPVEALAGALNQAETTKQPKVPYRVSPGVDILADLGLKKPIHRRI